MNTQDEILEAFDSHNKELLQFLQELDEEKFNQMAPNGGWSIAGHVEHLIRIEQALNDIFQGDIERTDRSPDEKMRIVADSMQNDMQPLNAPPPLQPSEGDKSLDVLTSQLMHAREGLVVIGFLEGWNDVCMDFSHGLFGAMTRLEWVYFCMEHGARHFRKMRQLAAID